MRRHLSLAVLAILLAVAQAAWPASQTRKSTFFYDGTTGLLIKEVIEPDSSSLCQVTTYKHDAYGNVEKATTRNCGQTGDPTGVDNTGEAAKPSGDAEIEMRTNTSAFAAGTQTVGGALSWVAGQFQTTSANALGHDETKEFDPRFGMTTRLVGPNGLATSWEPDGFGRKKKETRADGTVSEWFYERCEDLSGGTCPTAGKHRVRVTSTGAPVSSSYFDLLNREIRSETEGFDGTLVRKDTEYDALSRVSRTSKPYKVGETITWTTFAYDILGRVTQTEEPSVASGVPRTVTTHNGLVTTVTVSNAGAGTNLPLGLVQSRTITRNAIGQTVEAKDSLNNTITYQYDPFGNLTQTDAGGVVTTLSYDLRGRKTGMVDPDMGSWTYSYSAIGELKTQTDAKAQVTTMAYDVLGRMLSRTEPGLTSKWFYDAYPTTAGEWEAALLSGLTGSCAKGKGKLCYASADGVAAGNLYRRLHTYDTLARPQEMRTRIDADYTIAYSYDATGRLDTLTYPTGFAVKHLYNANGYLHQVQRTNDADTTVFWEATAQNAAGAVTNELLGNGLTTTRSYDTLFRLTATMSSDGSVTKHSHSYTYDPIGNVTQRVDAVQSVTENFAYDRLNRLTTASGSGLTTRSFEYSAIGNLTLKSDVGGYIYPAVNAARPHAVSSVGNSGAANSITATFAYDANGSLATSAGAIHPATGSMLFARAIGYTSFNMPSAMCFATGTGAAAGVTGSDCSNTGGTANFKYAYSYNGEHERVRLLTNRPTDGLFTSIYVHPAGKGALLYEKEIRDSDGRVEHKHYVNGAGLVGVYVSKSSYDSGEGPGMRYFHKDHLGSIAVVTGPAAEVLQSFSYEAFGERRSPNGQAQDRSSPLVGLTTDRGFTSHEHLDEMNLIHMNGRVYDPALARFMTADPVLQSPQNLQSYNRYSYVLNSPLAHTDPTGYFSLSSLMEDFFDAVETIFTPQTVAAAIVAYYTGVGISDALGASGAEWAVSTTSSVYSGGQLVSSSYTLSVAGHIAVGAGGGFAGGFVAGGNLKSGLSGSFSGALFGWAGTDGELPTDPSRYAAHAFAGCAGGMASGGGCGSGALAALSGKWVTNQGGNLAAAVIVGGTASAIGGGRFANGAATAAFGYLFNCGMHDCLQHERPAPPPQEPGLEGVYLEAAFPSLRAPNLAARIWSWFRQPDVVFGTGLEGPGHALRHLRDVGIPEGPAMLAIRNDVVVSGAGSRVGGPGWSGSVVVEGQTVGYSAYRLSDRVINVGSIRPARP